MNEKIEKKRIELIDYLKAICVIMVIFTHYDWSEKCTPLFTMFINMAVPVFMILSGYNFAMSGKKKANGKVVNMYKWNQIKPKLVRFLTPFVWICLIEIVLLIIEHKTINLPRIFLLGAYGPGSYYVPLMIQLLVIFPLIYYVVDKNAKLGLILSAGVNLAYEVFVEISAMEKYSYRLCIGTYILLIAFGCYLYLHPEKKLKTYQMVLMMMAGLSYIIFIVLQDRNISLFDYWTPTAMPVSFYIFPIVVILFRLFYYSKIPGFLGTMLSKIGKASYHIFLVQMVYYHFELGGAIMKANPWIAVPFNILVCVPLGLWFCKIDTEFIRKASIWKKQIRQMV